MSTEYLIPILFIAFAALLFFQMRKQRKAMSEQQKLQNSLEVGDRVMTTSGLFGTVVDTEDDSIELEIADGVVTTWLRQAIRERVETEVDEDDDEDDDDEELVDSSDRDSSRDESDTTENAETQKTG
ncbi:preprotein translocase subunit YajC [Actinopolyspora erythraea]|uniref:Preprotein translocase subunit YajC n=1 Tax=Actinopolyspora erythraea TaxID=414996 RepID=A0A099D4V2_9ACTN|nr:preprotein translocase subunit YajC [Actinopolyspora erythraea]ASU79421.1 preprotein translocase subunit YajC [Actinopolyspora erythraea]KGI80961.1 preprotein translocase subunit YajC [Actinopolyspora erythraea]